MVEENIVKADFARFADANVKVDYSVNKCEYVIDTNMNFTVLVMEDTDFGQYRVILKHESGKTYELSSYEFFKEYVKKHTKKLFGKKTMDNHMKAVSEFVHSYKDYFMTTDTAEVFLAGKTQGTPDIFIA